METIVVIYPFTIRTIRDELGLQWGLQGKKVESSTFWNRQQADYMLIRDSEANSPWT